MKHSELEKDMVVGVRRSTKSPFAWKGVVVDTGGWSEMNYRYSSQRASIEADFAVMVDGVETLVKASRYFKRDETSRKVLVLRTNSFRGMVVELVPINQIHDWDDLQDEMAERDEAAKRERLQREQAARVRADRASVLSVRLGIDVRPTDWGKVEMSAVELAAALDRLLG